MLLISYIFKCGSASLRKGVSVRPSVAIIHKLARKGLKLSTERNGSNQAPYFRQNFLSFKMFNSATPLSGPHVVYVSDGVYGGLSYLRSSTKEIAVVCFLNLATTVRTVKFFDLGSKTLRLFSNSFFSVSQFVMT